MNLFDTKVQYPQIFEALWKEYPLKVSKAEGYKAFKRLKIERMEELVPLIESIRKHLKTAKWRSGIICHLSTYLNQRRWEDELEPQKTESAAIRDTWEPEARRVIEEAWAERYYKEIEKKTMN